MASYITSAGFSSYANVSTASHDTEITAAITAAARAIDGWCGRTFSQNTSSTESRVFEARFCHRLDLDDFSSTTGLVVETDDGDTGTFGTTWALTADFIVQPANLVLNGLPWAYNELRCVGSRQFPVGPRPRVRVTATFGWPAVPDAVTQACYALALDLFKMKDSPFGVAGFNEYGVVRVQENKPVQMLLAPYVRNSVRV